MSKKQKQVERFLGINQKKKSDEPVVSFNMPFAKQFKMDWYLTTWFEKLVFALGSISLVYSIIRILAQGFW